MNDLLEVSKRLAHRANPTIEWSEWQRKARLRFIERAKVILKLQELAKDYGEAVELAAVDSSASFDSWEASVAALHATWEAFTDELEAQL